MDKNKIITFDALYEKLRLEKYRAELQKLEKDFFEKVITYLNEKREVLETQKEKESIFSSQNIQKTEKQLENTYKILKELYEKRESKIVQLALFCSRSECGLKDKSALSEEELVLFEEILFKLNLFRNSILKNLLEGKLPEIRDEPKRLKIEEKTNQKNKLVRLIQAVPQFVGNDMKTYGPFDKEEIVNLPLKVSEVLIKTKRAEEI